MRIQVHPSAEGELYEAAAWYDDQLPGLVDDLLAEIDRWVIAIAETPLLWAPWPSAPELDPPIRRVLTDRFPFAIAFQANPNFIRLPAFAHTSRRPLYWLERTNL